MSDCTQRNAWYRLTGWTDSTGLTDCTMKTLNATRSTLNPCMLRPKPEASLEAIRRMPCGLCRPVGASTGRDLSRFFGEAASQQAGEAGISTSAVRSQPSNPQPAQAVFPKPLRFRYILATKQKRRPMGATGIRFSLPGFEDFAGGGLPNDGNSGGNIPKHVLIHQQVYCAFSHGMFGALQRNTRGPKLGSKV